MNPYVGPRRFEEQDAPFFYGREQESRDLLAFVVSEPLVLFYAQSGAGKSSLIHASLVPGLRADNFEVLPVGRVGGNLPEGIDEVRNIYTFNLLSNLEPEADPNRFSKTMLTDYLAQMGGGNGQRPYRVLIIDQFEEIVTHHPGRWREREDFFWQLQAAIHNDPNLWVVLSMREDHFAAVESYAEILPGGLRARFRMERLRLAAAEMAVEKPAAAAGKPFEEGVAKELVKNLSLIRDAENAEGGQRYGEYVEPVQLQVVCYQLWENLKDRPMNRITEAHVQELGNVDRALGAFYDTAVQEVIAQSNISEIMLRNWFEKELITDAYTRGIAYQDPKTGETEGLPNDAVNQLADKYLLRSERRAGAVWYELVHDRFVDPILQANASWQESQPPIVRAALAWHESGRDDKWLMTAEQAKEELSSLDWRKLDKNVRAYAVACGRSKFQEQRREEILQTKLDEATSAIKEKNTQISRKNSQIRLVNFGLGFLLLLSIVALVIAYLNQEKAYAANIVALDTSSTLQAKIATVEFNSENSRRSESTMIAQSISADATIAALSQLATAPTVSNVIVTVADSTTSESTSVPGTPIPTPLIPTFTSTPFLSEVRGSIAFVRFPPNFDLNQGLIYRINADGRGEKLLTGSSYSSRDPNWSPDGSEIIFASNIDGDYEIYVMNADGEDPSQWRKLTNNSWDDRGPAFSPNGQWIAYYVDGLDGDQIYRMRSDGSDNTPLNLRGNFPAWSPDSSQIVFGERTQSNDNRQITVADLAGNVLSRLPMPIDLDNYWPSWSPDDSRIAYTRLLNSQAANTYICTLSLCNDSIPLVVGSNNGAPDWSPDGSQIVFYNDGGDGVNIWIMHSDGTNLRQITFSGLSFDTQPKWSP